MEEVIWESVADDVPVRLIEKQGQILAQAAKSRDQMYRPVGWYKIEGKWPENLQEAYNAIIKAAK